MPGCTLQKCIVQEENISSLSKSKALWVGKTGWEEGLPLHPPRETEREMFRVWNCFQFSPCRPSRRPPPPSLLVRARQVRFCGVKERLQRLVWPSSAGIVFGAHVADEGREGGREAGAKTSGCAGTEAADGLGRRSDGWTDGGAEGRKAGRGRMRCRARKMTT